MQILTDDNQPIEERTWFKNLATLGGVIRWAIVLVGLVGGYYIYQRDINAQNTVSIDAINAKVESVAQSVEKNRTVREQQIDEIKRIMLTRELYEAYHEADKRQMERIEETLKRILEK